MLAKPEPSRSGPRLETAAPASRHRGHGWAFLLLALWIAPPALAQDGDRTPIPGTHVALPVPEGFELAERFPGLLREADTASVMVSELPAPYAEISAGMTDEALASQGMKVLERHEATIDGHDATLIRAEQSAAGTTFSKWLGIFGDDGATVLVAATHPASGAPELSRLLRTVVLGAGWDREQPADPYQALGYRFDPTEDLVIAHETATGLVLLPPGVEIGVPGEHTMLVVGRSFREVEIPDIEAFARNRLHQVEQLSELRGLEGAAVRYGGFSGYELVGSGQDDGREVAVYQALLLDGSDYLLLIGTAPPAERQRALRTFRRVVASVRKVGAPPSLDLSCNRDRLLLGDGVKCALTIKGYRPPGLPKTATPSKSLFVPGAGFGPDPAGFVYTFSFLGESLGEVLLGPVGLDFEGHTLSSNQLRLVVLEPPDAKTPVSMSVTPRRLAVGDTFDIVVLERGVQLGRVRSVPSVRIGGKPVITAAKPEPRVALIGKDMLEIELGTTESSQATGKESERLTFYRAKALKPGRLTLDRSFFEGLREDAEVAPVTVEITGD